MNEEMKAVLNTTEKKRYQYSSEYFSRGAATQLKSKFNTPVIKGMEKVFDKFRKSEDDSEKNKISKSDILKNGLLFIGLLGSVVLLFDKLNKLKINPSLKRGDINSDDYKLDEERILSKIQGENGIIPYLGRSVKSNFLDILITGTKLITTSTPTELPYEWHKHLTDGQRQNGVFGNIFRNVALAAIWHTFERRGYGILLELFNLPRPVQEVFNVGMWKTYVKNPRQYGHVGRSLRKDSIRAAEIIAEHESKINEVINSWQTSSLRYSTTLGASYMGKTVNYDNSNEILESFQNSLTNIIQSGRFNRRSLEKLRREIYSSYHTVSYGGVGGHSGNKVIDVTLEPISIDSDDMSDVNFRNFRIIDRIPTRGEFKFLGDYMMYIDTFQQNQDSRVAAIVQELASKIDKYNSQTFITAHNENNTFRWRIADVMYVIQTMTLLGEYELYQALKSTNTQRSLYQDFFGRQMVDDYVSTVADIETTYRETAEQFAIDYANGRISLNDYIKEIGKAISEFTENPLNNLYNIINLHRNTYQRILPYGEIKHVIEDLKKQLRIMSVSGVSRQNLLVINNESLRDNFDLARRANVDTNQNVSGQQFGREEHQERKYKESELPQDFLKELEKRQISLDRFVGAYVLTYNKNGGPINTSVEWVQGSSATRMNIYLDDAAQPRNIGGETVYHEGSRFWIQTRIRNYERTVGGRLYSTAINREVYVRGGAIEYFHVLELKDPIATIFGKSYVYESVDVDDNGERKFYLDTITDYYYFDVSQNKWFQIFTVLTERTESLKSQAAIFRQEYDEQRIRDLYNTPIEVLLRNLKDSIDYVEEKLDDEYKLRKQLIDDIVKLSGEGKQLTFTL